MLKLTILRRYSENNRRVCEQLGEMIFDYSKGKLIKNRMTCGKTTGTFQERYIKEKEMIYKLFTSKKSLKKVFKEIINNGLKIQRVEFGKDEDVQVVILIDE